MGFFKSIGKGAMNTVKGAAIGSARMSATVAEGIGKGTTAYGSKIISNAFKNPVGTAIAVGGAAALGYAAADLDGRNDGAQVAAKAAIGTAAFSAIPGVTGLVAGTAMGATGAVAGVGGLALGIGERMIKMPEGPVNLNNLGDIKLSKLGTGLLIGGALFEGGSKAIAKFEGIRMGTSDNLMRKATPTIPQNTSNQPSYANNGGATGDLVFSMYNNR